MSKPLLTDERGTVYATSFVLGTVPFLDVTLLRCGTPFWPYHVEMQVYDKHFIRRAGDAPERAMLVVFRGVLVWRGREWPAG